MVDRPAGPAQLLTCPRQLDLFQPADVLRAKPATIHRPAMTSSKTPPDT